MNRKWLNRVSVGCLATLVAGMAVSYAPAQKTIAADVVMGNIIPLPVSQQGTGDTFTLSATTNIVVDAGSTEIAAIGQYLADKIDPATGYKLKVATTADSSAKGNITLTTTAADASLGDEGYQLTITADSVTIVAPKPAGLFYGVQTLRQLLPPSIDSATVQTSTWTIPTGTIKDQPRFEWRGAMLDVSRHFFSADDVKHYIDLLAYYKINRFHLHLSDDQGWRIAINSWPDLTTIGGSSEVGGGKGGFYTQADYTDIVNYAQSRYITVIPEIDMPGHTNAALASYPKLNCDGKAPALYTGTDVGFSSLCTTQGSTYNFIDDVVKEIAGLTPGPYIHIGGDESKSTDPAEYKKFVEQVQGIVQKYNKQAVGWEDIANGKLLSTTILQHWNPSASALQPGIDQGARVIMSPADKAYMDMKYDPSTVLGLQWAGDIDVQTAYNWDPATVVSGVKADNVLGIEAPLWSETLVTLDDIEYMAFPRIMGYAEIGWSAAKGRTWGEYKVRLGNQGSRLTALGVNFFKAKEVPWK